MCTTASLCSAKVDFVISAQDSLHAYSSTHVAQKVFLIAGLRFVEHSGRHPCCIGTNGSPAV